MTTVLTTGEPALRSFVIGLRADQDAVTAGLTDYVTETMPEPVSLSSVAVDIW
jgi:hypothetical protein